MSLEQKILKKAYKEYGLLGATEIVSLDDVLRLVDETVKQIRELKCEREIDVEQHAWNSAIERVLAVLGGNEKEKKV
jgi:hypothetical protein